MKRLSKPQLRVLRAAAQGKFITVRASGSSWAMLGCIEPAEDVQARTITSLAELDLLDLTDRGHWSVNHYAITKKGRKAMDLEESRG